MVPQQPMKPVVKVPPAPPTSGGLTSADFEGLTDADFEGLEDAAPSSIEEEIVRSAATNPLDPFKLLRFNIRLGGIENKLNQTSRIGAPPVARPTTPEEMNRLRMMYDVERSDALRRAPLRDPSTPTMAERDTAARLIPLAASLAPFAIAPTATIPQLMLAGAGSDIVAQLAELGLGQREGYNPASTVVNALGAGVLGRAERALSGISLKGKGLTRRPEITASPDPKFLSKGFTLGRMGLAAGGGGTLSSLHAFNAMIADNPELDPKIAFAETFGGEPMRQGALVGAGMHAGLGEFGPLGVRRQLKTAQQSAKAQAATPTVPRTPAEQAAQAAQTAVTAGAITVPPPPAAVVPPSTAVQTVAPVAAAPAQNVAATGTGTSPTASPTIPSTGVKHVDAKNAKVRKKIEAEKRHLKTLAKTSSIHEVIADKSLVAKEGSYLWYALRELTAEVSGKPPVVKSGQAAAPSTFAAGSVVHFASNAGKPLTGTVVRVKPNGFYEVALKNASGKASSMTLPQSKLSATPLTTPVPEGPAKPPITGAPAKTVGSVAVNTAAAEATATATPDLNALAAKISQIDDPVLRQAAELVLQGRKATATSIGRGLRATGMDVSRPEAVKVRDQLLSLMGQTPPKAGQVAPPPSTPSASTTPTEAAGAAPPKGSSGRSRADRAAAMKARLGQTPATPGVKDELRGGRFDQLRQFVFGKLGSERGSVPGRSAEEIEFDKLKASRRAIVEATPKSGPTPERLPLDWDEAVVFISQAREAGVQTYKELLETLEDVHGVGTALKSRNTMQGAWNAMGGGKERRGMRRRLEVLQSDDPALSQARRQVQKQLDEQAERLRPGYNVRRQEAAERARSQASAATSLEEGGKKRASPLTLEAEANKAGITKDKYDPRRAMAYHNTGMSWEDSIEAAYTDTIASWARSSYDEFTLKGFRKARSAFAKPSEEGRKAYDEIPRGKVGGEEETSLIEEAARRGVAADNLPSARQRTSVGKSQRQTFEGNLSTNDAISYMKGGARRYRIAKAPQALTEEEYAGQALNEAEAQRLRDQINLANADEKASLEKGGGKTFIPTPPLTGEARLRAMRGKPERLAAQERPAGATLYRTPPRVETPADRARTQAKVAEELSIEPLGRSAAQKRMVRTETEKARREWLEKRKLHEAGLFEPSGEGRTYERGQAPPPLAKSVSGRTEWQTDTKGRRKLVETKPIPRPKSVEKTATAALAEGALEKPEYVPPSERVKPVTMTGKQVEVPPQKRGPVGTSIHPSPGAAGYRAPEGSEPLGLLTSKLPQPPRRGQTTADLQADKRELAATRRQLMHGGVRERRGTERVFDPEAGGAGRDYDIRDTALPDAASAGERQRAAARIKLERQRQRVFKSEEESRRNALAVQKQEAAIIKTEAIRGAIKDRLSTKPLLSPMEFAKIAKRYNLSPAEMQEHYTAVLKGEEGPLRPLGLKAPATSAEGPLTRLFKQETGAVGKNVTQLDAAQREARARARSAEAQEINKNALKSPSFFARVRKKIWQRLSPLQETRDLGRAQGLYLPPEKDGFEINRLVSGGAGSRVLRDLEDFDVTVEKLVETNGIPEADFPKVNAEIEKALQREIIFNHGEIVKENVKIAEGHVKMLEERLKNGPPGPVASLTTWEKKITDHLAKLRQRVKDENAKLKKVTAYDPDSITPDEAAQLQSSTLSSLSPGMQNVVRGAVKKVQDLLKNALYESVESGMISKGMADLYSSRGVYTGMLSHIRDFSKRTNEDMISAMLRATTVSIDEAQVLREYTADRLLPLEDGIDSFVRSLTKVHTENAKNFAARTAMDHFSKISPDFRLRKNKGDIPKAGEATLAVWRNGKKEEWVGPARTIMPMLELSPSTIMALGLGTLSKTREWFTKNATTFSLGWGISNLFRDPRDARIFTRTSGGKEVFKRWKVTDPRTIPGAFTDFVRTSFWNPFGEWADNFTKVLNKDPELLDFYSNYGGLSTLSAAISPKTFLGRYFQKDAKGVRQVIRPRGLAYRLTGHRFRDIVEASETATKLMGYRRLKKEGDSPLTSAIVARRASGSPDFGQFGDYGRPMSLFLMFANPNIQEKQRWGEFIQEMVKGGHGTQAARDLFQQKVTKHAMTVLVGTVAWELLRRANNANYADDDNRPTASKRADEGAVGEWILPIPTTTKDNVGSWTGWKVPQSTHQQVVAAGVDYLLAAAQETDPQRRREKQDKAFDKLVSAILPFSSDITVSQGLGKFARSTFMGGVSTLNPALGVPAQIAMGKIAWGDRNINPAREEKAAEEMQYGPSASPFAITGVRLANKALRAAAGSNAGQVGLTPGEVDLAMRAAPAWGEFISRTIPHTLSPLLSATGLEKKFGTVPRYPYGGSSASWKMAALPGDPFKRMIDTGDTDWDLRRRTDLLKRHVAAAAQLKKNTSLATSLKKEAPPVEAQYARWQNPVMAKRLNSLDGSYNAEAREITKLAHEALEGAPSPGRMKEIQEKMQRHYRRQVDLLDRFDKLMGKVPPPPRSYLFTRKKK